MVAFLDYLPRGESLSESEFKVRHTFLQWVLAIHLPALLVFGLARGYSVNDCVEAITAPAAFLVLSRMLRSHRLAGLAVTAGLSTCSAGLVVLSGGSIEAHFHFFVTIGLIALYQDWVPFFWNAAFTTVSHGIGSWLLPTAFFAHVSGQHNPWTWSIIHGVAVLAACAGVMVQMRFTEDDHRRTIAMRAELVEGNRRRFTADLLVNLARRNQNLIYRQLELLNRLEDHERDAEQLSHLFQLDHLATRIRRNAESLLVLSGEEPARKWGGSVLLVDVVRASIAEIEELDRVDFSVDESLAVSGRAVADATHLLAELIENAVHFSPPGLSVMIRTRPYLPSPGAQVLTIEDWGVGMAPADLADANDLLRCPREVDLASAQRLGLHVVARLAARYGINASLESTPGGGVTAVVVLPAELFAEVDQVSRTPVGAAVGSQPGGYGPGGSGPDGSGPGYGPGGYDPRGYGAGGFGASLAGAGRNRYGSDGNEPGADLNGYGFGANRHGFDLNGHGFGADGEHGPGLNGHGLGANGDRAPSLNGHRHGANRHGAGGTSLLEGPDPTPGAGTALNGRPATRPPAVGPSLDDWAPTGFPLTPPAATGPDVLGRGNSGRAPNRHDPAGHSPAGAAPTGGIPTGRKPGPAPTGPAPTNPAPSNPAPTNPAPTDPARTDPAPTDAARTNPAARTDAVRADAVRAEAVRADGARVDAVGGGEADGNGWEDGWSSWWPLPVDVDGLEQPPLSAPDPSWPHPQSPVPSERPPFGGLTESRLTEGRLTEAGPSESSLLRRTPQANLADELRRGEEPAPDRPVRPPRDPAEARSALSRFQATQRAAREGRQLPGTAPEGRQLPGADGEGRY